MIKASYLLILFMISFTSITFANNSEMQSPGALYEQCVDDMVDEGFSLEESELYCDEHLKTLPIKEAARRRKIVHRKHSRGEEDSGGGPGSVIISRVREDLKTKNILVEQNGKFESIPSSVLLSALDIISKTDIAINPEGVFMATAITTSAILILKYGRSANPFGAFALGLGLTPAMAADLCSRYDSVEGLDYFFNELNIEEQFSETFYCPRLAGQIMTMSENIKY